MPSGGAKKRCDSSTASACSRRAPAGRRQFVRGTPLPTMRDSASKSNCCRCGPPTALFRLSRLPSGLRMAARSAQDVRQLQRQAADLGLELARLGALGRLPGVRQQPRRHLVACNRALRRRRAAPRRHAPAARCSASSRRSPRRQTSALAAAAHSPDSVAAGTVGHGAADVALQLQPMAAQPLAFDAARRHVLQHRVRPGSTAIARTRGCRRGASTSGKSWRSAPRSR